MAKKAKKKQPKKVSISLIKKIPLDELGGVAEEVRQGIFILNPNKFPGTRPISYDSMGSLITDFTDARSAFKQGGTSAKKPYEDAIPPLVNCLLSFAPYVNEIADGNETILKLSNLPYTGMGEDVAKLIRDGGVATKLAGVAGTIMGELKTTCTAFGRDVFFIAFAALGAPFPKGTTMNLDGQIIFPAGAQMPPFAMNANGKRDKMFTDLTPGVTYYIYYVMIFGGAVSALSNPLKISCGS